MPVSLWYYHCTRKVRGVFHCKGNSPPTAERHRWKLRVSECVKTCLHTKRAEAISTKLKIQRKVACFQATVRGTFKRSTAVIFLKKMPYAVRSAAPWKQAIAWRDEQVPDWGLTVCGVNKGRLRMLVPASENQGCLGFATSATKFRRRQWFFPCAEVFRTFFQKVQDRTKTIRI